MCIKINKIGKQEVGIWWVQKRFARYGIPIWSLWPNIRFLPSIVAEKNATTNEHICSMCIKINSRQTGSRNLMGPNTLPTIWGTNMKLVTKYQISAINSCWEKCAYMFNVYKNQLRDTNLKGNHPGTIPARFGLIWFSGFRGEDLNAIFYQNMPNLHNRNISAERKISQKKPGIYVKLLLAM